MPELPDIVIYIEALERRIVPARLERIRISSPFLLRTVDPSVDDLEGRQVVSLQRVGKRIVIEFENDLFAVLHLMIAGRLLWADGAAKIPARIGQAAFDFNTGSVLLTEAGSKRRASLHLFRGAANLATLDRGGIEPLDASVEDYARLLRSESHTLKRSLTDPRLFSGIGNAYSDEILHRARLSPVKLTSKLTDAEIETLYHSTRTTIRNWIDSLRASTGDAFPSKVTAFREGMAVHGKFGKPCPDCATPVQRIVYADNETNYCPRCQTGGRLLADRGLSRLLGKDWPKTLEE